jgi:hypothetical protein
MRRKGIWVSVVGALLTLVGGVTVLVVHDSSTPSPGRPGTNQPASATEPGASTATTISGTPAANRPPGTIGPRTGPGTPASPVSPANPIAAPPATPEQVAELLAGLPLQLEQAATTAGEPRELPPEEVEKILDGLLCQLGAQPC